MTSRPAHAPRRASSARRFKLLVPIALFILGLVLLGAGLLEGSVGLDDLSVAAGALSVSLVVAQWLMKGSVP
ncbi:MAG: hypothetical protein M1115_03125 [Actinobacteria bacterium]|nr:hypothetical protein [Actinomycetota bacterium]